MSTDAAKVTHVDRTAAITHAIKNQPNNQLVIRVSATGTPKIVDATARAKTQFSVTATVTPSVEAVARAFASLSVSASVTPSIVTKARATPSVSVPVTVAPNIVGVNVTYNPLLQNLQFFADYEPWQSGDPLPNRWDTFSGITSLTDNNTVGADTSSPLIGSKSASHVRSKHEYFSHPRTSALSIYDVTSTFICWVRPDSLNLTNGYFVSWSVTDNEYWLRSNDTGRVEWFVYTGSAESAQISGALSVGSTSMITAYHDPSVPEIGVSVNAGSFTTTMLSSSVQQGTANHAIGSRGDGGSSSNTVNGEMDNVGFWHKLLSQPAIDWLYNSGAGRSWSEIKNYNP